MENLYLYHIDFSNATFELKKATLEYEMLDIFGKFIDGEDFYFSGRISSTTCGSNYCTNLGALISSVSSERKNDLYDGSEWSDAAYFDDHSSSSVSIETIDSSLLSRFAISTQMHAIAAKNDFESDNFVLESFDNIDVPM